MAKLPVGISSRTLTNNALLHRRRSVMPVMAGERLQRSGAKPSGPRRSHSTLAQFSWLSR